MLGAVLSPTAAFGADSVFWTSGIGNKIGVANLDGSGGANLGTGAATVSGPVGTAIDSAAGRVYWANSAANKISFANLDGSGGGDLNTGAATVGIPIGIAIDPAAGRVYWANLNPSTISFANLDGSGGGNLNTGAATISSPEGVAIDPATGRIYWANSTASKISFANLDGSGGADLNTGTALIHHPEGIAIDPAIGRFFWANPEDDTISFANLDGSGGGGELTTGVAVSAPAGLAIDPEAGRIYWASRQRGGAIVSANINGSGGGRVVNTSGANVEASTFPVLLLSPSPQASPEITGGTTTGSVLSCSQGTWAPDLLASLFYRAPQSFAFHWSLDDAEIPGAEQNSLTAAAAGTYRCQVTATNHAGSSTQTSAPLRISDAPRQGPGPPPPPTPSRPAFGPDTKVTLALLPGRVPARGPIRVGMANANDFAITGSLSAQTTKPIARAHKRRVALRTQTFDLAAAGTGTLMLTLPGSLQRQLADQHKLSLSLSATVADPAGNRRTVLVTVVPKLQTKRRRG